jgi:bifunctional non-homologous end joining protein LigD
VHDLKHDGYRLQIHVLDGRVTSFYNERRQFGRTAHNRTNDHLAFACAFDLLMVAGEDLRGLPLTKCKAELRGLLKSQRAGVQDVEHTEGDGDNMFEAVCKLGLEGMVSKRAGSFYRSGPSKMWIKGEESDGAGREKGS